MEPSVESSTEKQVTSPIRSAQSAASSRALASKVTELETLIAVERAENARRLKEVDGHMRVMRGALQELQSDFRRISAEREQLRMELEKRDRLISHLEVKVNELREKADSAAADREGAAAEVVAQAIGRAQEAERELAEAREAVEILRLRARELEHAGDPAENTEQMLELRDRVAEREDQLIRAAETIREYEERLVFSEDRAARALRTAENLRDRIDAVPLQSVPAPVQRPPADAAVPDAVLDAEDDDSGTYVPVIDDATVDVPEPRARKPKSKRTPRPRQKQEGPRRARPHRAQRTEPAAAPEVVEEDAADDAPSSVFPDIEGLRFEKEITRDTHGAFFYARETGSRRPVAVALLPGPVQDVDTKRTDALILARHPNLVSALSYGVSRSGAYVVFERPVGEPADQWVGRIGPLPERIALAVALQVARGLRQAAFHGVVHGDLEPSNVRIDPAGRVQLMGVGTSSLTPAHRRELVAPGYASPERLRGSPPPDARTDIYALGSTLYFLLTGVAPFEGDRDAVLRKQAGGRFPDPRAKRPEISEEVAVLVQKLTAADPDRRPVTWDQVLVELERRVPGESSPELAGNLPARLRRFASERPQLVTALAVVPLGIAAAAFYLAGATETTVRDRYAEATVRADQLATDGDLEAARRIYSRFLSDTGDPVVEREAAARLDDLWKSDDR